MDRPDSSIIQPLFDLYRAGEYRTLLERTRALLQRWPEALALHSLAGSACLELREYDAAIRSYQAALALSPGFAKAHNGLGIAYLHSGQDEAAADSFHDAVRHDSQFAQAWFNLGLVYENRQRLAEAAGYYKRATQLNPVYHQAFSSLAKVLWELRLPGQVAEYFEKALAIDGNYLPAQLGLLRFLEQANRHDQLRDAVSRARNVPGARQLARLYEGILADIDGAHEQARALLEAFSIDPADTLAQHGERTRVARLARICDRLDDTAAALRYARGANELSRTLGAARGIDKGRFLQFVANRRRYFNAGNVAGWPRPAAGTDAESSPAHRPVFILGFPRAGTTLLDTLLRGHPAIEVAEETGAVAALVNRLSGPADERLDTLAQLSTRDIEALRQTYFDALARHAGPGDGVTRIDRFALNTVYAGEIHRVFPQARIILLLRHPADCVLSCFMQTFYETSANASFLTLEDSACLYDQVFGLWRQYTDLLQLNVLQVKYEDLSADVESTCRQILDFLGLPWHPDVLAHERSARERPLIGTASYDQVTRPLDTEAQGRWRRYRVEMQAALPTLAPWIRYFDYDRGEPLS